MSERAMMSDLPGEWDSHQQREVRRLSARERYLPAEAEREARRILAETEPEDAEDGLGDAILGWPYQDTPTALRNAMAESLAAFLSAPDPGAYLATVAR